MHCICYVIRCNSIKLLKIFVFPVHWCYSAFEIASFNEQKLLFCTNWILSYISMRTEEWKRSSNVNSKYKLSFNAWCLIIWIGFMFKAITLQWTEFGKKITSKAVFAYIFPFISIELLYDVAFISSMQTKIYNLSEHSTFYDISLMSILLKLFIFHHYFY